MKFKVIAISLILTTTAFSKSGNSDNEINTEYEKKSAKEKQELIWKKVLDSEYKKMPNYAKLGPVQVLGLASQRLRKKVQISNDFAPKGWKKFLHKRGAVAKVEYKSIGTHKYSGVFKGAKHGIIRLSLTYKPIEKKKPVAPGLALKLFRDGTSSANVSALYTLSGQGDDYDFFKNKLSNIVPAGDSPGEKVIHYLFSRVSNYPEQLKMSSMAMYDEKGAKANTINSPVQIFFEPNESEELNFDNSFHDIREDFVTIKPDTLLYKVHAVKDDKKYQNFSEYEIEDIDTHFKNSTQIGEIVLKSNFVISEFGDTGIFFKHDVH